MIKRARSAFAAACLSLIGLAAMGGGAATASAENAFPGQGFLPQNRAWEMVSPADKNGGFVIPRSWIIRAAEDGSAIKFSSLTAFGDALGTGYATDYMAVRGSDPDPGTGGWATHSLMPKQEAGSFGSASAGLDPRYLSIFTSDLSKGVFHARYPLSVDPGVAEVSNLYVRDDARAPGQGSYQLVTACPLCVQSGVPLPPLPGPVSPNPGPNENEDLAIYLRPTLVGASPDLGHLLFESVQRLTADSPTQPAGITDRLYRVYEWDHGTVRLVGRAPAGAAIECDDTPIPTCLAATFSIAGSGSYKYGLPTPHVISDGSDGHTRAFFTVPTEVIGGSAVKTGNLYARTDGTATAKLNVSEREVKPHDAFTPARYLDATPDGSRVFFLTNQALTDDAPTGQPKLYSYDTTKPATAPDNLTFLSPDGQPGDDSESSEVVGVIGASDDGSRVYFVARGQFVADEPPAPRVYGIYLWDAETLRYVGPLGEGNISEGPGGRAAEELVSSGSANLVGGIGHQARVTSDGRRLLFGSYEGTGLLSRYGGVDHDHGGCALDGTSKGCRELYLYDTEADSLRCVSCNPDGSPSATVGKDERVTAAETMTSLTSSVTGLSAALSPLPYEGRQLSADGRYAFFSTAQRLVPEDTNGTVDAYVFDSELGEPRLLSSGEDSWPSFFLDASASGTDAFIVTRERLSGWDLDSTFDLYDARIGGGFPEPPPPPPGCVGDACQPPPLSLNDPTPASAGFQGPGNPSARKPKARCPKGARKVKARGGKSRCVKQRQGKRAAKSDRRAGR